MLHQIIYVSNRYCENTEVDKILEVAQIYNRKHNITGLLLFTDTKFIQTLEGDKEDITTLYSKIEKDTRHKSSVILVNDVIRERSFPSWQMASKRIGSSQVNYVSNINREEIEIFESVLNGQKENGLLVLEIMKRFFYV